MLLSERELVRCEYLVLACRRRDPQAAAELAALFQRPLLFYLRRLVSFEDDAWDLSQETWLAVLPRLSTLHNPRALPAYVFRTARNKALAMLRKQHRYQPLNEMEKPIADVTERADASFTAEDAAAIHRALDRLSLAHREILTLHFLDEIAMDDLAFVLEIPSGTVRSRLHYAKRALRAAIEEEHSL